VTLTDVSIPERALVLTSAALRGANRRPNHRNNSLPMIFRGSANGRRISTSGAPNDIQPDQVIPEGSIASAHRQNIFAV